MGFEGNGALDSVAQRSVIPSFNGYIKPKAKYQPLILSFQEQPFVAVVIRVRGSGIGGFDVCVPGLLTLNFLVKSQIKSTVVTSNGSPMLMDDVPREVTSMDVDSSLGQQPKVDKVSK